MEPVGGAWPEAVAESGPAVAGEEDDAGAAGKLLRFYSGHRTERHSGSGAGCPAPRSWRASAGLPDPDSHTGREGDREEERQHLTTLNNRSSRNLLSFPLSSLLNSTLKRFQSLPGYIKINDEEHSGRSAGEISLLCALTNRLLKGAV